MKLWEQRVGRTRDVRNAKAAQRVVSNLYYYGWTAKVEKINKMTTRVTVAGRTGYVADSLKETYKRMQTLPVRKSIPLPSMSDGTGGYEYTPTDLQEMLRVARRELRPMRFKTLDNFAGIQRLVDAKG